MISCLPVSSRKLHDRTVKAQDQTIGAATLFPMFDGQGVVRRVMLVDGQSAGIRFFDPSETAVKIGLWGPIGLDPRLGTLVPLDGGQLDVVGRLWHFDPWWLLAAARYRAVEGVDVLKATNCVELLSGPVRSLLYDRKLCRVGWVWLSKKGQHEVLRFRGGMLPDAPRSGPSLSRPAPSRAAWRLTPLWTRPEWLREWRTK